MAKKEKSSSNGSTPNPKSSPNSSTANPSRNNAPRGSATSEMSRRAYRIEAGASKPLPVAHPRLSQVARRTRHFRRTGKPRPKHRQHRKIRPRQRETPVGPQSQLRGNDPMLAHHAPGANDLPLGHLQTPHRRRPRLPARRISSRAALHPTGTPRTPPAKTGRQIGFFQLIPKVAFTRPRFCQINSTFGPGTAGGRSNCGRVSRDGNGCWRFRKKGTCVSSAAASRSASA